MEIVTLPIEEVFYWDNNARIHTKRNIEALKESLQEFSQTKPLLVQKSTMKIIAGNGTYSAMLALGYKEVKVNLLDLDDVKAEALAIMDNRTGLLSQWDEKQLTASLQRLKDNDSLNLTGFDTSELDKMLQFQSGDLFEKLTPDKPSKQKKEPPAKAESEQDEDNSEKPSSVKPSHDDDENKEFVSFDEQLNFTLHGFIFTCSAREDINELRLLIDFLKDAPHKEKEIVNKAVFSAIREVLTEKFMR